MTRKKLEQFIMKKIFPERTVVFNGFDENGNMVEIERIIYKAGGFKIKERKTNLKYN